MIRHTYNDTKRWLSRVIIFVTLPLVLFSCTTSSEEEDTTQNYSCCILKFGITSVKCDYHVTLPDGRDSSYVGTFVATAYNFAIDQENTLIYNRDSLPFGTIPRAVTSITYAGSSLMYRRHDAWPNEQWTNYSNNDTISYTEPMDFVVVAKNGDMRRYTVTLNIHTQDAEKWNWEEMDELPIDLTEKKVASLGKEVLLFGMDETVPKLLKHNTQSSTWEEKTLEGLSSTVDFSTLCNNDKMLFVNDTEKNVYKSNDGETWTLMSTGIDRLLAASHKKLYAIKDGDVTKCDITDGAWRSDAIDDMGSLEMLKNLEYANSMLIEQQDSIERLLIVGCYTKGAQVDTLAHCWSKSWFAGKNVQDEEYSPWNFYPVSWVNTSVLPAMEHLCVVTYDGVQLAFGGRRINSDEVPGGKVYISYDRGLTWRDDSRITFPYDPEMEVVATNTKDNHIWLIQGTTVLKGRQYKLGFE